MSEVYVDPVGISHEIVSASDRVPMSIHVRCALVVPAQFGPRNVAVGPVTCLECISPIEYVVRCEYCRAVTGTTPYEWAVEDCCDACSADLQSAYQEEADNARKSEEVDA